ncbi:MAG: four helix bundle protein [Phycisphaera sp.]|nr:four helix bundle protein [Phycisphaera sp.]
MSDAVEQSGGNQAFDLSERTAVFGEQVIRCCRSIKRNAVTNPLISQVVRAATSIGANYDEADEAPSKKDFRYRIAVCKKEARETKRFLRMLGAAIDDSKEELRRLWKEAHELHLIFATIHRNSQDKH